MPDKPWKRMEREVAKKLGGIRITLPEMWRSGGDQGDVWHPEFYVEVKRQKRWRLYEWWCDMLSAAAREHRIPLLVVGRPKVHGAWVFMMLDDFVEVLDDRYRPDADTRCGRGSVRQAEETTDGIRQTGD